MIKNLKKNLKKDIKILAYAFLCGLVTTVLIGLYTSKSYSEEIQGRISSEVIRFHVRANSDSEKDQQLKLLVKNRILEQFHEGLSISENIEETRTYITNNLSAIKSCAEAVISEQGYDYPVSVKMCKEFFPTKIYGDVSLPPGEYESLRVDIGESEGNNWWCCMFPPLCFVDVTRKELSPKEKVQLKSVLTDEEYDLITKKDAEIQIKFKLIELWQNMKAPKNGYAAK